MKKETRQKEGPGKKSQEKKTKKILLDFLVGKIFRLAVLSMRIALGQFFIVEKEGQKTPIKV